MLPINASLMPAVRTRTALLIIDLQNDFVSPTGALPVTQPEGFLRRTLDFVQAFRDADVGDVIWVRSEFAEDRALSAESDQIILADLPMVPARMSRSARGRTPVSDRHEDALQESDEEAFLSRADRDPEGVCVRPGSTGAELAAEAQAAVDPKKDLVITKTHYSAFASGHRLVQLLRGRFVTEMYVCGALSNISIYATALDAGKYGYDMTLVEDCCGYRNEMRHMNALQRLGELLGTEPMTAKQILDIIRPKPKPSSRPKSSSIRGGARDVTSRGDAILSAVRPPASTGLSPLISSVSLSGAAAAGPPLIGAQPQQQQKHIPAAQPPLPMTGGGRGGDSHRLKSMSNRTIFIDPGPLEVDSELDSSSPERESRKRRADADRSPQKDAPLKSLKSQDRIATAEASTGTSPAQTKDTESDKPAEGDKLTPPSTGEPSETKSGESDLKPPALSSPPPPVTSHGNMKGDAKAQAVAGSTVSSPLCEGDTTIITDALSPSLAAGAFDLLKSEVSWASMSRLGGEVPRRVAVQGEVDEDGSMPVYRHPTDESPQLLPFSPTVLAIKKEAEKHVGHPLNHVLIQHYRSGNDYISEHSDKTLDIVRGSFIANVSLGAERTMVFRTKRADKDPSKKNEKSDSDVDSASVSPMAQKKAPDSPPAAATKETTLPRTTQRAPLPHNSLCRMGLETNMRWLHAIRQDKRPDSQKSAAEVASDGERISLTFRHIATYLDAAQSRIWGQGAEGKTKAAAKPVVNGQTAEAVELLRAFGRENHSSEFDWDASYAKGFNVLHMGTPKRFCRGPNLVMNMQVDVALAELGVASANGAISVGTRFEDNDPGRAVVDDCFAILLYLDGVYGPGRRNDHSTQAELAKKFDRFARARALWAKWREAVQELYPVVESVGGSSSASATGEVLAKEIDGALTLWKKWAEEEKAAASAAPPKEALNTEPPRSFFIASGEGPSVVDYAVWPVLHEIVRMCGTAVLGGAAAGLHTYYHDFGARSAVARVVSATPIRTRSG